MRTNTARKQSPAQPAPERLSRAQLRELERDLRSERARLERSLMSQGATDGMLSIGNASPAAPASAEAGLELLLETRAHAQYSSIVDAIRRLENGEYGDCVSCRQPIPFGRLSVMPEATYCVACGPRG